MRKGVKYFLAVLGAYKPAEPVKSALIDVGSTYGVTPYSVDKIRKAGLHCTVRECIQMCLLSDFGLDRLIQM